MSFDHTTGASSSTAPRTVSATGLSITTDPGSGIIAPGWHADVDGSEARAKIALLCAKLKASTGLSYSETIDRHG